MDIGKVQPIEITSELSKSYLDYAMSVIVARALPDVRDGLKPVHRRILFAMHQVGLTYSASFSKSAKVVGEVLGKYHPHGDIPVYDALVRLAQDFSMRYPLVKGQGNFGCFTKDTKIRLTDGRSLDFVQLIKEQAKGKRHWGYTFNTKSGLVELAEIKNPRLTRKKAKLIEIELDNGNKIRCTPDHRFLLRNGKYKEAKDFSPGESLMPLYTKSHNGTFDKNLKGYERVLQPKRTISEFAHLYNHKVVRVTPLAKLENVYDLTTEPWHNFAIDAVFVHNSVDGDPPAAMRYSEVKLAKISDLMLTDIEKDTVDFLPNFDATLKEPVYLPALLPNLLLMGSEGIAVGMATKIPPHNLNEVVDAIVETIKRGKVVSEEGIHREQTDFVIKKINLVASGQEKGLTEEEVTPTSVSFESEITVEDLIKIIPGPDFPTGAAIYDSSTLAEVYSTGRGKITVRGVAEIKERGKGRSQIIISEIPYQVNKAEMVAKIAELVKEKKVVGISDLRDESDKEGLSVVVELKRDAKPKSVLNNIYKHTRLQTTFPANFVALVDGTPHTLNLKQILSEYVKHRQKIVIRRTIFELTEAKKRAHILEGLKIALDNLNAVIKTIRSSRTQEDAKSNLIKKFGLSDIQATAILDMQLRRLAALEREKIEKEYQEMKKLIDRLTAILKDPKKVLDIIVKEIVELKEKFGDARKTKIYKSAIGEFSEEDLVAKEETLITVTKTGYIKRLPRTTYKAQRRGGKGVVGMTTKEEDEIEHLTSATTHDTVLFFTDSGRVFGTKAWEIPETTRQAKGQALVNILNLSSGEEIRSIVALKKDGGAKHLIMATSEGVVKKTSLSEFENLRASGLIAIRLKGKDSLVSVKETSGDDHILLLTKNGKAIRFPETNARPMGRPTSGVAGIKLEEGDRVISMEVFSAKEEKTKDKRKKTFRDILTISEGGLGKRTPVHLFPVQKRSGKGVKGAVVNQKTGKLVAAMMVTPKVDQVVITSRVGQVIKLPIKNIPRLGRATQGVILMRFANKTDAVAACACLEKEVEFVDA